MKSLHRIFTCVTVLFIFSTPLLAQEEVTEGQPAAALSLGENFTIKSEILSEDRPYMVYLPEGCKEEGASAPCPVLYILDGGSHFHYGSGMLARMSENSQIPETIMVAIPNTADRGHDLTPTHTLVSYDGTESSSNKTSGGGDAFLDFLEKELIPEVEARYNPMPYRIFSGHSLGGLMALHSFIERPALFQAYIAVDPSLWWDDKELVKRAEKELKSRTDIRNKVFITVAEHRPRGASSLTVMETTGERFAYALEANPSPHLYSAMKQFPGENHGSVAMPSLYEGLLFVFDGYSNPPASVTSQGLEAVVTYYENYLAAHGITLLPPEGVLVDMAMMAGENDESQKAIEYHQYNVEIHPGSPLPVFMLAMAYKEAGEKEQAIELFQSILEMAPQFETYVKPLLEELEAED